MNLRIIEENISRLIIARRNASNKMQKVINEQLTKLYDFKREILTETP